MGWIKNKYLDDKTYLDGLVQLWDGVRDSIGLAVIEFNQYANGSVTHKDCTARSEYCVRIEKEGGSIEVFIDPMTRCVKKSTKPGEDAIICKYRPRQDHLGLEFSNDGDALGPEEVCKRALESFLFPARTQANPQSQSSSGAPTKDEWMR